MCLVYLWLSHTSSYTIEKEQWTGNLGVWKPGFESCLCGSPLYFGQLVKCPQLFQLWNGRVGLWRCSTILLLHLTFSHHLGCCRFLLYCSAAWPQRSCFASLSLSFLICKMGRITTTKQTCWEDLMRESTWMDLMSEISSEPNECPMSSFSKSWATC